MNPRLSTATPAAETFNVSVFGTRPVATSKCDPSNTRVSLSISMRTVTRIFAPSLTTPIAFVLSSTSIPSCFKIAATPPATSASSPQSNCPPDCTIVTRLPNRRNICPNSSPTYPPPRTIKCSGTAPSSMIEVLSRNGTSFSPSIAGTAGRAPALIKILSPVSTRCPPSLSRTSTDFAPVKLASPKISSRFAVCPRPSSLRARNASTMSRLRFRTRSMSMRMFPVWTP